MIIVEERIGEVVATLPVMVVGGKSFKVSYGFGSHKDLLKYMRSERKKGQGVKYPLIWVETPISRDVRRDGKVEVDGFKIIIATLSDSNQSNASRLETKFKPILIPLYERFLKRMMYSGFIQVVRGGTTNLTNYYNYGVNEEKHVATDIWDAIVVKIDLIIGDGCIMCASPSNTKC